MSKEIILHIGAPKTGTTFLQNNLESNKTELNIQGINLLLPNETRELDFYDYLHSIHTSRSTSITTKIAQLDFNKVLSMKRNDKTIISEEGFSLNLMPSNQTMGGFSGISKLAHAIKRVINHDTTIILTIRNQVDFIQSSYKHKIKWKLCSFTFDEFLNRHINFKKISWLNVINTLEENFPGKVKVIPFEIIKHSQIKYFHTFLEACGVPRINLKKIVINSENKNKSMSDRQSLFMQQINKSFKLFKSFDNTKSHKIFKFVQELLENESTEQIEGFKIQPSIAKNIKEFYREENIKILKKSCSESDFNRISKFY